MNCGERGSEGLLEISRISGVLFRDTTKELKRFLRRCGAQVTEAVTACWYVRTYPIRRTLVSAFRHLRVVVAPNQIGKSPALCDWLARSPAAISVAAGDGCEVVNVWIAPDSRQRQAEAISRRRSWRRLNLSRTSASR